ncbi:MAG: ABC transporter ATP-binding protein [Fimbriimonadaceae bacterium]|nr:ABC transporter ATP-binding protein [Fimbriimonadaceae bacterium]
MIALKEASLVYHDHGKDVFACREIDLQVGSGEFLGILGPSGSGKSSLLYLMCGLKLPTSGSVWYEGQEVPRLSDSERAALRLNTFGFVFQHPFLVGYLSALENVVVASPVVDRREEALELLVQLGLEEKLHRLPHELSGGERQRVCVARALLGEKRVIFGDEPTAALDHKTGLKVMETLNSRRRGGSLVIVTHDPSMLEQADRIVRISDGELE